MADQQTEQEWEKSKRIEAERMKAARALAATKPDRSNLAFLDPKSTKVKGWSSDPDVLAADAERMSGRAMALTVGGAVLMIIGYVGGIVTEAGHLGAGGVIISGIPSGIGGLCMAIGALLSLIILGLSIIQKIKYHRKFSAAFWTAIGALIFGGVFIMLLSLIMQHS